MTELARYMAGHQPRRRPWRIGDRVTNTQRTLTGTGQPAWDGTVVDLIGDDVVRVYWRYPLGKLADHHPDGLVWVT
jgi:hypothetical protein